MRVVSHTCSNTEIVCALGAQDLLIAVDNDSDYPPDVVSKLVPLGRDLQLDVDAALALKPDLVLTSLTVPGHERIVAAFEQHRSEEHTSELQSLMRISYAVFCLKKTTHKNT